MRQTVECEAIVFDLEALVPGGEEDGASEPSAGAGYLLSQLPGGRWGIVTAGTAPVARHRLEAAGLPLPSVLVATETAPGPDDLSRAVRDLGADPSFAAVVAGSLSTLDAAAGIDALIAVASAAEPAQLRAARHVVPSLSSVRVLGQHPVLVLEVDTIPDL